MVRKKVCLRPWDQAGARGGSRVTVSLTPDPLCPQIYFWEAQRRNLTERVKTLFLAENSVKLKNLTGYTAYMVSVAAFNAAGDGPRSTPARGQTQQAGGRETGGTDGGEGGGHLASGLMGEWRQLSDLGGSPGPMGCPPEWESAAHPEGPRCVLRRGALSPESLGAAPRSRPSSPHLPPVARLADGQSMPSQPPSAPCLFPPDLLMSPWLCSLHQYLLSILYGPALYHVLGTRR